MFSPMVSAPLTWAPRRPEGRVLRAELRRARLEDLRVLRRPPVAQRAGRVDLAALVVEAVRQLVADDRAGRAVVDRRIRRRSKIGGCRMPAGNTMSRRSPL